MKRIKRIFFLLTIGICIFLVGCYRNELPKTTVSSSNILVTNISTEIENSIVETETPKLLKDSLTPANQFLFDQNTTPTKEKTITKIPTLPALEAENKVLDLLQDNGGCKLPCFWGMSTDQISKQTIISFFESYFGIGNRRILLDRSNSEIRISTNWVEDENDQIRYVTVSMGDYRTIDMGEGPYDEYVFDNPLFYEYTKYYSLSNVLSTYGKPEKVYVFVDPGRSMGFEDLYYIHLDYSKLGFYVVYVMELTTEKDYFVGCPEKSSIYIKLWAPGDTSLALEADAATNEMGYHPLAEMTTLTVEEFYEIYKSPDNHSCLRTKEDFYKQYMK